jgi:glutathione S-transferase
VESATRHPKAGTHRYLHFRFPAIGWRDRHANLARLHDKLALRHSFIDTMPQ